MASVAEVRNPRMWLGIAFLAATLAMPGGPVRADAPEKAAPTKAATAATRKTSPQDEVISPRWIGPKWEIKGLTIWVFTPGHFEGR